MPLGRRSSMGVVAGVALALALPVAAGACTPDEYLTAEERESGLYDTTPPDYYAQSDAPHTHGDGAAPAPSPAESEPTRGAARPERESRERSRPAAEPAPAPATTPVVTAPQPVVSAPAPSVTAAEAAAAAAAEARAAEAAAQAAARRVAARRRAAARAREARARVAEQRDRWRTARTDPPALRAVAGNDAPVARTAAPASDQSPWALIATIGAAAALMALVATALPRRRRRLAVLPGRAPAGWADEVEAELQEMLAEEHARRTAAARAGADDRLHR